MSANSRQNILDRIQAGTRPAATDSAQLAAEYAALPRPYLQAGNRDTVACIALLVERLREYDAEVIECAPDKIAATITAQLAGSGRHSFLAPPGLPDEWLDAGREARVEWKIDYELPAEEIDRADGVVTAAFCAVADSGTIVLHHSPAEGRRVLTLLPDWHLCVLRASQLVETFPEYFVRCAATAPPHSIDKDPSLGTPPLHPSDKDPSLGTPPLVTWISGPSATADIEMTRIKGVHGPRFLHVILVRDDAAGLAAR